MSMSDEQNLKIEDGDIAEQAALIVQQAERVNQLKQEIVSLKAALIETEVDAMRSKRPSFKEINRLRRNKMAKKKAKRKSHGR